MARFHRHPFALTEPKVRIIACTWCAGDALPANAPLWVTGLSFSAGDLLQFTITGLTSNNPGAGPGNNPDESGGFSMTNYGARISAPLSVRVNALLGVFLGDASLMNAAPPGQLNFGDGINFGALAPENGADLFYR